MRDDVVGRTTSLYRKFVIIITKKDKLTIIAWRVALLLIFLAVRGKATSTTATNCSNILPCRHLHIQALAGLKYVLYSFWLQAYRILSMDVHTY